jgi:DNA-directed RNA polymerase subunit A'
MQRRLINALEDLKLKSDGTVRNTADSVIQFKYGDDGVDPCRSVQGEAIDIDDILVEVLGDEAELLSRIEEKKVGGYATVEKDLMEAEGDEEDELETDNEFEAGGEE